MEHEGVGIWISAFHLTGRKSHGFRENVAVGFRLGGVSKNVMDPDTPMRAWRNQVGLKWWKGSVGAKNNWSWSRSPGPTERFWVVKPSRVFSNISHLELGKIIDSKIQKGRGYVSSVECTLFIWKLELVSVVGHSDMFFFLGVCRKQFLFWFLYCHEVVRLVHTYI